MPTVKTEESCCDGLLCRRILQSVDERFTYWDSSSLGFLPQSEKRRLWFRKIPTATVLVRRYAIPGVRFRVEGDNKGDLRYWLPSSFVTISPCSFGCLHGVKSEDYPRL